jgi:hypothetical protein
MRTPKNATERLALRAAFIPKNTTPILEHTNGSALFTYELAGKLLAIAFWGTSAKPFWHHSFRTEDQRNRAILEFKAGVESSVEFRTKRQSERKATTNSLKVGDILNTSWGYDQTNVDFFVVTRVSAARVWVRQIASDYEATGHMSGKCWPAMPIRMIGEETMHIARGTSCSINGHHASPTGGDVHHTSSYA